jgi:hypothetical protein
MICSSVNRFRFICPSFVRADSKSFWRKFLGAGHTQELFGNGTTNGFDILSFYDGRSGGGYYSDPNGGTIDTARRNGTIDANDPIYGELQIWRDLNQDGIAEAGELTSLAQEGIALVNLSQSAPDAQTKLNAAITGNAISTVATFVRQDGSSAAIADAWLSVDQSDTIYNGPAVAAIEHWPDLHGYGNIDQLHNAMAKDPQLASNVRSFIDKIQTQPLTSLMPQFENLMYEWAGIPPDYSPYRGESIHGRVLTFLEKAYGQGYVQCDPVTHLVPKLVSSATRIISITWASA